MVTEFKLPELGEGIDGGDVIEVLVSEGDQVDEGQTLLELETSKATIPVPAPHAGRVAKVHVKSGDHVTIGQSLVSIGDATKSAAPTTSQGLPSPAEQGPPREQRIESHSHGDQRPDEESPYLTAARQQKPSQEAAQKAPQQRAPAPVPRVEEKGPPGAPREHADDLVPAGPATRRLARELGVDLHDVTGSSPGGRITEDDVKAYVRQVAIGRAPERIQTGAAASESLTPARKPPPLPDFSRWGPVTREPLGSVRRKTAEHMSLAWSQIPQVTQFDEADITELEQFRKRHAGRTEPRGGKLTVTVVALKAVAVALRAFPQFNSSLDPRSADLIVKNYYHIGVAVDTDRGLLVPVIRDVDKKNLLDLAAELSAAAERARQRKLSLDDLQGGTFTITNLGGIGGTGFSPIVNYPEVAILGLARAREQQIVRGGRAEIRLLLPLCLSYDHRVIDGAAAARFTRRAAELLEDPFLMALEG